MGFEFDFSVAFKYQRLHKLKVISGRWGEFQEKNRNPGFAFPFVFFRCLVLFIGRAPLICLGSVQLAFY